MFVLVLVVLSASLHLITFPSSQLNLYSILILPLKDLQYSAFVLLLIQPLQA